jgi:autotransporter-associated beta strand protein
MSGAFGGLTRFIDSSTAGNATITNNGSTNADGGDTAFNDTSTAGSATITNNSSQGSGGGAGITEFNGTADAGSASITNLGGAFLSNGGETHFHDTSSAANANITNNGGASLTGVGGTKFTSSSTAGSATITNNGGSGLGASGGFTYFLDTSTASSATLIANGGTTSGDGGLILISNDATGGTARVEVFGNGELDISTHNSTSAVTVGSIEGSGNVFLGANSLAVGSNNMTTTFSGVIQDGGMGGGMGGSLDKIGSGTLTLSGTNTYTGDTLALVGSLLVDGSIASPVTFVIDGGLLGGNGIIGGDVQVNDAGVVSPGDSLGTLTVNGNYSQGFAGILRIEIGGLNSGVTSDLLNVNGAAGSSLGGTLQLVRINNFTPLPGDRVTIINDPNGHMGMFATVTSNFTGLTQPMPMYDEATDVYVVFELSATFESQGLTRNQMSVGEAVDDVVGDSRASALIAFLGNEPMGNLPHDFDLIAPEELASIYEIGFSQAVVTNMNLQHRMDDIRAGSTGFCANGYQAQETGGYSKESDGKVALDKNPTPAFVPSPENRWGIFATGSGDFVNVGDHDLNAHGYDITTGNVIVGVDYRVCDHFAVGIDGSYAGSTADLVDRGRVEVDGGKAGAYATVFGYKILGSVIHIDGAVSGGWNSYDTHRTGLEDLPVLGSTNGSELNAMLAYGGDWHFGCLLIGTWSSLQYTNVNIDSFTETGSLAPLHIESQDEYSLRGTTGLRMAYDFKAGRAIIRPEVRAAYQHEYGDRAYPIDASLASGAGDVFTVHGPAIGRDSALVDAGFAVQWSNRISTYVYYDGVFGRTNYENNAVSGGLRVSF